MLLERTSEQQMFWETSKRFLESEMPLVTVRQLARSAKTFERGWWGKGAQLGWTSLLAPESLGGGSVSGDGLLDLSLIADLFGRHVSPGPLIGSNLVVAGIASSEDPAHREVASAIMSGDVIGAWCLSEPTRSLQISSGKVTAERRGSQWLLRGNKGPVESAVSADFFLVVASTKWGLGQFVVPATSEGVACSPLESLDAVRDFGILHLDNVLLPLSAAVGEPGQIDSQIDRLLQIGLTLQLAETVGAADHVLEFSLEWVSERYSFGRPLASYQELKHRFADMRMWLEASHATAEAAARAVAVNDPRSAVLVSVAKSYVAERMCELVQDCVQMHGGIGVTWDHDIHLFLRRVTQNRLLFGLPAEHRALIAKAILDENAEG